MLGFTVASAPALADKDTALEQIDKNLDKHEGEHKGLEQARDSVSKDKGQNKDKDKKEKKAKEKRDSNVSRDIEDMSIDRKRKTRQPKKGYGR